MRFFLALLLAAIPALPALARSAAGRSVAGRSAAGRSGAESIEANLEAWDIAGAQAGVDEQMQSAPDSPETAYFRGRVLFEQGKYQESVKQFEEARSHGAERIDEELRLARAAAAEVKGDQVHESAHFTLRTRPGKDALLVPYALSALERSYDSLTKDLGYAPKDKIRVEVYESAQALARVSPLTVAEIKASGTIALCKYNRLMITSPRALLRGYSWLDTLAHEFTHYLVTQKGRNTVPIWLQEGLAKFLETRWRGEPGLAVDELSLQLLTRAAKAKTLIPFAAMHPSIAKLPTQEKAALAFAEVEAAMRLLYLRGGQTALTELVAAMASGMTDEQAVAQAYGKSFPQFEADWRAEVAKPRRKAQEARPLEQHQVVFKEDARSAKERPVLAEEAETKPADPEAKRAVRLGELLFARHRWSGAAQEYAKARARLPQEIPQIARRYAFAELQLGHFPEAETALSAAVARDPDDEAAQVLYAQVLAKRGAFDKARAALEMGIAQDPFDPDLHAVYVVVAQGEKNSALEAQEKNAYALATGHAQPQAAPAAEPVPPAGEQAAPAKGNSAPAAGDSGLKEEAR